MDNNFVSLTQKVIYTAFKTSPDSVRPQIIERVLAKAYAGRKGRISDIITELSKAKKPFVITDKHTGGFLSELDNILDEADKLRLTLGIELSHGLENPPHVAWFREH